MPNSLQNTKMLLPSRNQSKSLGKVLKAVRNAHTKTPVKYKISKKAGKRTGLI